MPFWFLLTPVIYPLEQIPDWRWLVAINPMAPIVEAFKWGTLGEGRHPGGLALVAGAHRADDGDRACGSSIAKNPPRSTSSDEDPLLHAPSGRAAKLHVDAEGARRRGHQIHLAFMMQDKLGDGRLLWELTNDHPNITYTSSARRRRGGSGSVWRASSASRRLRPLPDARVRATPTRCASARPAAVPALFRLFFRCRSSARGSACARSPRCCARSSAPSRSIAGSPTSSPRRHPDVVLVTPLVDLGSDQVEYVKAARALGIRSGLCVHSWDNLTNKGLIRVLPDRVFVWNEAQKREAVAMHRVKPEHVVVDRRAGLRPVVRAPAEHHARGVLPQDRPAGRQAVLPLSLLVAVHRAGRGGVRRRLDPRRPLGGRSARPRGGHPHPPASGEPAAVAAVRLRGLQRVALWPRGGANPVDAGSKNDYFDSMYHAAAAVGVNTSAQIEAGIVGRPVYSVRVASTPARRKARCTSTTC